MRKEDTDSAKLKNNTSKQNSLKKGPTVKRTTNKRIISDSKHKRIRIRQGATGKHSFNSLITKAVSAVCILFAVCISLYIGISGSLAAKGENDAAVDIPTLTQVTDVGEKSDNANSQGTQNTTDKSSLKDAISVLNLSTGEIVKDDSALIVAQALEAISKGKGSDESLKAQAVAIYSFLIYHGADNNASPSINLEAASEKSILAATAVKNKKIQYNGRTIEALWCDISAGKTADNADVWGDSVAYLKSVDSSADIKVAGFQSTHTYKSSDVQKWVKSEYSVDLSKVTDKTKWFVCAYDKSTGLYATKVNIGSEKTVSGMSIRYNLFTESRCKAGNTLESQAFTVKYDSHTDSFIFNVRGSGNGVGMSIAGAEYLAKQGYTYDKILAHFYTGTVIA